MKLKSKLILISLILLFFGSASSVFAASCGKLYTSEGDYYYQCDGTQVTQTAVVILGDIIDNFTNSSTAASWRFYDGVNKRETSYTVVLPPVKVNLIISSSRTDYDLFIAAGSPVFPVDITLTIASGTVVSSTRSDRGAIYGSQNLPAGSIVSIINNGAIIGRGGDGGGAVGPNWITNGVGSQEGGPAISLVANSSVVTIAGKIYGGGGGGGYCPKGGPIGVYYPGDPVYIWGGAGGGAGGSSGGHGSCGYAQGGTSGINGTPGAGITCSGKGGGIGGAYGSPGVNATCTAGQDYWMPGAGGGKSILTNNFNLCIDGKATTTVKGDISSAYNVSCPFTRAPLPTVTISATPNPVVYGNTSVVTWSSTNTVSCSATDGWTISTSTSGSINTSPLRLNKNFAISCITSNGAITYATTTIQVNPASPTSQRRINSGLIGYWPFDEVSGSKAIDYSVNGNDGNILNGVLMNQPGKIGKAYSFDGVDDIVNLGNFDSYIVGKENLSFSAWIKGDSFSTNRTILSNTLDNAAQLEFYVNPSNITFCDYTNKAPNGWCPGVFNQSLSLNSWHLLVAVFRPGTVELFVDGVSAGSRSVSGTTARQPGGGAQNLIIGGRSIDSYIQRWDGMIDEVAIWNRALSNQDVSDLYNGGQGMSLINSCSSGEEYVYTGSYDVPSSSYNVPDTMNCGCGNDSNSCSCGDSYSCPCGDSNSCPCGDDSNSCACGDDGCQDETYTCECGTTCSEWECGCGDGYTDCYDVCYDDGDGGEYCDTYCDDIPETWGCTCGECYLDSMDCGCGDGYCWDDSNSCPCGDDSNSCPCGGDSNSCYCGDDPYSCSCGDETMSCGCGNSYNVSVPGWTEYTGRCVPVDTLEAFIVAPSEVLPDNKFKLSYRTSNFNPGDTCVASGGSSWSGPLNTNPAIEIEEGPISSSKTFSLVCTRASDGKTASDSKTVNLAITKNTYTEADGVVCSAEQVGRNGKIYVNKNTIWSLNSPVDLSNYSLSTQWLGDGINITTNSTSTSKIYTTVGIKKITATTTATKSGGTTYYLNCSTSTNVILGNDIIKEL